MWRFQTVGSKMALLKLCVSIYVAMKMLGKETAVLCSSRCLGVVLILLSIKLEIIFFQD